MGNSRKLFQYAFFSSLLSLGLIACGDNKPSPSPPLSPPPTTPPTALVYSQSEVAYKVNEPIKPNIPCNKGGDITQYSVSPVLPQGLNLDPSTGVISGTPVQVTAETRYIVTGSNEAGQTTTQLKIEIVAVEKAPEKLSYSRQWAGYPLDILIPENKPTSSGGPITSYTVSPDLPPGLNLNPSSGIISGAPTQVTKEKVYTVTGKNDTGTTDAKLTIQVLGKLESTRSGHTATLIDDNKVLITGGTDAANKTLSSIEVCGLNDNKQWECQNAGNLKSARKEHTATLIENGKILITGGNARGATLLSIELCAPKQTSQEWTCADAGNLYVPRRRHTATLLNNDGVLITGGEDQLDIRDSIELCTPVGQTWQCAHAGNLTIQRTGHTATSIEEGNVLIIGGSRRSYFNSLELCKANGNNQWTCTADAGELNTARARHTATLIDNNQNNPKLLITGGENENGSLGMELCQWQNEKWHCKVTQSVLVKRRSNHTATLLNNKQVLIAGGSNRVSDESWTWLDSMELWDPKSEGWISVGKSSSMQAPQNNTRITAQQEPEQSLTEQHTQPIAY